MSFNPVPSADRDVKSVPRARRLMPMLAAMPLNAAIDPFAASLPVDSSLEPPTAAREEAAAIENSAITGNHVIPDTANDLATRAYARLAAGDRRAAARLFDAALAIGDPRAAAWRTQRDALARRWSGSAYGIVRARGVADLAVTPVLGGGQSGGGLAFTPDPLDRRPFALTVRGSIAHDDGGRSAVAAVGVAWHPISGITLAAERLIPLGPASRGDWTIRAAGGAAQSAGTVEASAYGEAGIVGRSAYAAAQARAGRRLLDGALSPGIGAWASVQRGGGRTVGRVDLGPGITARARGVSLAIDYRFRVAGNAAPGSGPVLTLSAAF